ncbi:hypothetical protein V5799_029974 [Amblyomma americanum]|uniref:Uncharacterized protein n=1 Tax=Amblyomma americanum TaxID=6943 RepID=A0AAQ4EPK9_AMBAM
MRPKCASRASEYCRSAGRQRADSQATHVHGLRDRRHGRRRAAALGAHARLTHTASTTRYRRFKALLSTFPADVCRARKAPRTPAAWS